MECSNIYTFRHSELPPLDDAIKQQMAEIDLLISNFISSNPGHYRALSAFAQTLYTQAGLCEIKLESIRIIADCDVTGDETDSERVISLNNLPQPDKSAIAFEALKARTAILFLANARGWSEEEVLAEVLVVTDTIFSETSVQQEAEIVHQISQNLKEYRER
ncbi:MULTISPECIES: hypothetical protein [unclassified Microcoleus]|uniref:hypothetical protein n=1 Tax=unclassified Microcoleus TaxID=2642155 RepID=UPI002FD1F429